MQTASIWLKQKPSKVAKSKPSTKGTEVATLTEEEEKQLARSRLEQYFSILITRYTYVHLTLVLH